MIAAVQTGALAVVGLTLLGLFFVLAAVNRHRAGQPLWPRQEQSAATIRLSPEHTVHVVEIDGRRWLVGTGPGAAPSLLAELDPEASATPSLSAVDEPERTREAG